MAIAPARLFGPQTVSTVTVQVYTVPIGVTTTVTRISFNNITNGAVRLKVWIVRSGNSPTNNNLCVGATANGLSISAGPSDPYVAVSLAGLVLTAGDAIWLQSDTANGLVGVGSGWTQ